LYGAPEENGYPEKYWRQSRRVETEAQWHAGELLPRRQKPPALSEGRDKLKTFTPR